MNNNYIVKSGKYLLFLFSALKKWQEYFDQIHAPRKQLYLMEDTRHLVTGKSEEFSRILHEIAEIESKYSNE